MHSYQAKAPSDKNERPSMFVPIAVGGGAFVVGVVLAFGYVQWNAQKQQLAMMTQMVERMAQQPAPVAAPAAVDAVTRTEKIDLLEVVASAPLQAEPVAQAPVAALVAPAPIPQTPEAVGQSTADKLRALVAATPTAAPTTTPTLDEKAIANARRLETFAIIHAGVQELVAAVVAGEYDIHTDYEDENFSGRIHFSFVGHEEDQTELEQFLAKAADDGIVAHSKSVVDENGKVNGHILLFDLVERALENGTLEEQAAGAKLKRQAVAMLAKDAVVGQTADASGERFYTVESGDSLAFIALQFYGNTNAYTRIFEANRNKLNTPDKIRVGQRLVIPKA